MNKLSTQNISTLGPNLREKLVQNEISGVYSKCFDDFTSAIFVFMQIFILEFIIANFILYIKLRYISNVL